MHRTGMTDIGGDDARFPPTLWSQVLSAQDPGHPEHRIALEELIRRYWKPIYAYIRYQWSSDNEQAKDHTQAFFTAVLEKDFLKGVDPAKGNFRAFLKGALKHFLLKRRRDEKRLKRGGGSVQVPFEEAEEISSDGADPAKDAEEAFDRAWRRAILEQGIKTVREDLTAAGKSAQWQVFESAVLAEVEVKPTYEQIAERLGIGVSDVANHLHAVRKKLREHLRRHLIEGLGNPADLDTEWRAFRGRGA